MPAHVSVVALGLAAAIIGLRLLLLNAGRADRAFNLAASLLIVVAALRDHVIQRFLLGLTPGALTLAMLNQISEATITLSAAAFLMVGLTWLNAPQSRIQTIVVWIAAGASVLAVEWSVRSSDPGPAAAHHLHAGWAVVAYAGGMRAAIGCVLAHDALSYAICILLLVICYREIRGRPRGLELLACIWVLLLASGWLAQTLSASVVTIIAATGGYNAFVGYYAAGEDIGPILSAGSIALLGGIPVAQLGVEWVRAEIYSRILNYRLGPLWAAMTAVCPEMVHSVPVLRALSHPRYQLHLRVIEIRDATMILSRYITDDMVKFSRLCTDLPTLQEAIQLQMASAAKLRGDEAAAIAVPLTPQDAEGLIDDAVSLLGLAGCWSSAARLCAAKSRAESNRLLTAVARDCQT